MKQTAFKEEKKTESLYHVKNIQYLYLNKYINCNI